VTDWVAHNQRMLMAAVRRVRGAIERHGGGDAEPAGEPPDLTGTALGAVVQAFGLTHFERDVLVLCAGVELDSAMAPACAAAQDDAARAYPTFGLALAALAERLWRLVEVEPSRTLTRAPLRIDERVLHYLAGVDGVDERIAAVVEPVSPAGALPPSQQRLAERLAAHLRTGAGSVGAFAQLSGADRAAKRAVAAAACSALATPLVALTVEAAPTAPAEQDALLREWRREVALGGRALLVDGDGLDGADPARTAAVARFVDRLAGAVLLSVRDPLPALERSGLRLEVGKPTTAEQQALWRAALGEAGARLNGRTDELLTQFDLDAAAIASAISDATAAPAPAGGEPFHERLWDACRRQTRPKLDDLAQRLTPAAGWDDLVLPEPQRATLREIAAHVRARTRVYEHWGFAARSSRGLGIAALFSGASGTGKTMAAEVLAGELRLDLYRIDLSAVVSKYIGETEKNLRRLFDAAEGTGAILLFDEADALFGKRTEIRDSHDRYANIEIAYLLQRIESYRGLAILTTNLRNAIDSAFLRRIRFVVQFPFPDAEQRLEIWRRLFPDRVPLEDVEFRELARLSIAGGNIRNIGLNAAFLAADAGDPVRMEHLMRAAYSEYAKLEQPLSEAELRGWT
jgi:hypothetical protein